MEYTVSSCSVWAHPAMSDTGAEQIAFSHCSQYTTMKSHGLLKQIRLFPSLSQTGWYSCRGCSRTWLSPRMRQCRLWCPRSPQMSPSSLSSCTRGTATPRSLTPGWGSAYLAQSLRRRPIVSQLDVVFLLCNEYSVYAFQLWLIALMPV